MVETFKSTNDVGDFTTISLAFNPSGSARTVVAQVSWYGASPTNVSTMTYGGNAMTFIAGTNGPAGNVQSNHVWYLAAAPSGAQTWTMTCGNISEFAITVLIVTNSNASPLGAFGVAKPGAVGAVTNIVATAVDDLVLSYICFNNTDNEYTPGTGGVEISQPENGFSTSHSSARRTATGTSTTDWYDIVDPNTESVVYISTVIKKP